MISLIFNIYGIFILFLFNIFYAIPLDLVLQHQNYLQNYSIVKLLRDFIQKLLTRNDSLNNHFRCNIETDNKNPSSFQTNTTKHHLQNQDIFDEENDS